MQRNEKIEVLASREEWSGRVFKIVRERLRLPSGLEQDLAVVEHPGAVAIAALQSDGTLVLVRQYRHAAGDWLIEVPAGRLERGEDPLSAAKRELEEEAGMRAGNWVHALEFYPAPGFCSERMHLFLATQLTPAGDGRRAPDPDEELDIVAMLPRDVLSAPIKDAKTLIAAQWLLLAPPFQA